MNEKEQTNEELCFLAARGSIDAQNKLTENNTDFIKKTAKEVWRSQSVRNQALPIEKDDLVQEGCIGLLNAVSHFDSTKGLRFLTYAAPAIRNSMLNYINSFNTSFESKEYRNIFSLDEEAFDETTTKHELISDPFSPTSEERYLSKKIFEEVHVALNQLPERERIYLEYRFGFDDEGIERSLAETAYHFHFSLSRAKSLEQKALDDMRGRLSDFQ